MAYGPLALKPVEFWSLTLVELSQLAAGYEWRDQRAWERLAWAVCHMLNASGKQMRTRITVRQLLKRPIRARDQDAWWSRIEKERAERKLLAEQAARDASENGGGN